MASTTTQSGAATKQNIGQRANAAHSRARRIRRKSSGRKQPDHYGQDINQRVDVKVIVNKGIEEGAM